MRTTVTKNKRQCRGAGCWLGLNVVLIAKSLRRDLLAMGWDWEVIGRSLTERLQWPILNQNGRPIEQVTAQAKI